MSSAHPSPTRLRTRQAIVEAAISVWVRDRDATLGDIAAQAQTHRTTLHRHFESRVDLLDAAVRRCIADISAATESTSVDQGPPLDALRRVVGAYLAIGDRIRFLFEDLTLARSPVVAEFAAADGPVMELIRRCQAEGTLDPWLPPAWIETTIWALVYAASEAIDNSILPAHEALGFLLATIERGITGAGE